VNDRAVQYGLFCMSIGVMDILTRSPTPKWVFQACLADFILPTYFAGLCIACVVFYDFFAYVTKI